MVIFTLPRDELSPGKVIRVVSKRLISVSTHDRAVRTMRLLALSVLLLFVVAHAAQGADYALPKRVLIIDSFGPSAVRASAATFRTTLERELGQPIDIYQADLDVARFAEPDHEAQLIDFLKLRFAKHKLDLVVTILAPATQFMVRNREQLFADTPFLVMGTDHRLIPPDLHRPTTTYVAGELNLPGHIEHILRILPHTQRVVMVHGASKHDKFWASENRRELQRFADRVELVWLEGRSLADMRKEVALLPSGSVVFLGRIFFDAAGLPIGRDEALESLRAVSKVPIFGYFESSLGRGIVGGKLYPEFAIGVEGARVAIRIINGEAPGAIEPRVFKETAPVYDWRELQRFGIGEDRLPPGSEIRYRQPTVWQAYRWHIAAVIALLLLQAALISGLVVQGVRRRRMETARKRAEAELQHTRAELTHMTRVSALGELSTSLAHELNQPLTAILSNAQAAQRFMTGGKPADLEEVREILGDIVQDDHRAGEVIRRMRSLVKKEDLEPAPLDMATAMREVSLLLHSDAVLRNINVSLDLPAGLPAVLGDKVQLQQVALNLLLNAFDAVKDSARSERAVVLKVEPDDGDMMRVAVSDTGSGLSADSLDRMFDAFYTTKRHGLGMGLSISRSIVNAHGGRLWAENNRDRGAMFYFTVPLAHE